MSNLLRTRNTYGPDKVVDKAQCLTKKSSNGKMNHYLCLPNERSVKLSNALNAIKAEKKATNYQLCAGLCGNGTMSEILHGKCGATDEFFAAAVRNIGASFGDLLRKAGLFDPVGSVGRQEDERAAQLPGQVSMEDVASEPVTAQSGEIERHVAEKQFTEAEKKYLAELIRKALKNTINRCAEQGSFLDPERYGMMMHILEVLEQ